jgi:hypothetical protein
MREDGMVKVIAFLLLVGGLGFAIYWFVTKVLPVVLIVCAIAGGSLLALWALGKIVGHVGVGPTLIGLFVMSGVPALIIEYIMNFTGDFEARRLLTGLASSTHGLDHSPCRSRPRRRSTCN